MHRTLLPLLLLAALSAPRPSAAACPGTELCRPTACPAGVARITPGSGNPIQRAIAAAGARKTTFCVLPGTYSGGLDFLGKKIVLIAAGGPSVTFLTAPAGKPVVTFKTGEGVDSVLDGFTIQNGKAPYGGGILIDRASPTIQNSILRNNSATGDPYSRGGGILVRGAGAAPVIRCTQFLGNSATYGGGGLGSYRSANPHLRSNRFDANRAPYGGAISVGDSGRLDVAGTDFSGNQASGDGGAIHTGVTYGNVLVRQCWFRNNGATGFGGALWAPAGLAEVLNSTFTGNRAATGGAIAAGYNGTVNVWNTIFAGNTTAGAASATLDAVQSPYPSVAVNQYNLFWANTGGTFANTLGDQGLVTADPRLVTCCPGPGSPALDAGGSGFHFNDADGSRNDIGACGGPVLP